MTIDCDRYRVNVPVIAELTKDMDEEERLEFIATFSAGSHVPIIAVACYIGELYGVSEALQFYLNSLILFYRVSEVKNTSIT